MINDLKTLLFADGFYVKDDWIKNFDQTPVEQLDSVKKKFLETNIDKTSEQISDLLSFSENHRVTKNDYVVQVDEVVDISLQESDRIVFKHSPRGTLKFLLNTGGEHFVAIEKEKIDSKNISVFMQPGSKIKIKAGSDLWYGVLFLNSSNVLFLGGYAPELVEKRRHIYRDGGSTSSSTTNTTNSTSGTNTNQELAPLTDFLSSSDDNSDSGPDQQLQPQPPIQQQNNQQIQQAQRQIQQQNNQQIRPANPLTLYQDPLLNDIPTAMIEKEHKKQREQLQQALNKEQQTIQSGNLTLEQLAQKNEFLNQQILTYKMLQSQLQSSQNEIQKQMAEKVKENLNKQGTKDKDGKPVKPQIVITPKSKTTTTKKTQKKTADTTSTTSSSTSATKTSTSSTKPSSQTTKSPKKQTTTVNIIQSPQSSPKRKLTQSTKKIDVNNFELSTSSDDSDDTTLSSTHEESTKQNKENSKTETKKQSQEKVKYLKSSDSSDNIPEPILIEDSDKSADDSKTPVETPKRQTNSSSNTPKPSETPEKSPPTEKKSGKLKLTQQRINKYLNESNDDSDIDLTNSDSDKENSPPREVLPPISPSTGVYDMISLNALPPSKGSEYLVNAKFSKLKDIFLSGNEFIATCDITNGDISSTVSIDPEIIYRGMEISSVEEYRNLDDDDIPRRHFLLSEYMKNFSPPIKVKDLGEKKDHSPRFVFLS